MTEFHFCSTSSITVGADVVSPGSLEIQARGDSLLVPFGGLGADPEIARVDRAGASLSGYTLHDGSGNIMRIYARNAVTEPPYMPYGTVGQIVVLKDGWTQSTVPVRDFFQRITFQNLLERLDSFAKLIQGWAGPGSVAPTTDSLESARKLLHHARAQGLVAARVTPASGSVFIRFASNDKTVDLECEADGSITALLKSQGLAPKAWELAGDEVTMEVSRIRADLAG